MSHRISGRGRFLDRSRPLAFRFNGQVLGGYAGDTLASALLANDRVLLGRSFKYHRPRGLLASGAEEPNALMEIGTDDRFEPDRRATGIELFEGLVARSQNHWPGLGFDIGAINGLFARFLSAGFYYKTFMFPAPAWKHLFEPLIRRAAGLGRAPDPGARDPDRYEHFHVHVDVLVAGGGIAGLQAALAAGRAGARVLLVEQTPHWGGRAPVDGAEIAGMPAERWINGVLHELENMENVVLRRRCSLAGVHDHGYALACERLADHLPPEEARGPRHRLWRIRARRIITATGAIERPLAFPGNDRPGVMLASAVRDYLENWGVMAGRRVVIVTNNDNAYRTALAVRAAGGGTVAAVVDARSAVTGALPQAVREAGIPVLEGRAIVATKGGRRLRSVIVGLQEGAGGAGEEIACDCLAMSGGWSPVVHLWSHCAGKLLWDADGAFFRPDPARPPRGADGAGFVIAAGTANGRMQTQAVLEDADSAGRRAARETGFRPPRKRVPGAQECDEAPLLPVWQMPARAGAKARMKMWIDFQNDVKLSDIVQAAGEGYESVEHTKRYTTLGMANDQGKLSNINGIAVLSDTLGRPVPQTGTTTFRPPYTPLSFGAVTGEARGELFQPLRRTPLQGWHEENGADFEPVGQWRRPYCYRRGGETRADAVQREVRTTRESLGLLDASTLGKILVCGPDAGKFLDLVYTNMISTLPVGRCRYGLMCNENGFLMDDGVVARLDEQSFLCHTTTGGAEHVHAHMEDWLQCEWWDLDVHTLNLTEQYAQIAVVGPNARSVLERLGGIDVSRAALPFMHWSEGRLGGFDARIFRISFSGELSFEIAVPAGQGLALWQALLEAGAEFSATPYGTEALHVMRAEKGYIMIGDETDGTVTPLDLGLSWAVSKKKADFIGKRGLARPLFHDPERWRLVGLETPDGSVLPEGAYALAEGTNAYGRRATQGRVTSTYFSPTLGRGIALGLIARGPERMGEVLEFSNRGGAPVKARITDPVFLDPQGERQHA